MTTQQAADEILEEAGKPLTAKEIVRRGLERGLMQSQAGDAINSLAQTVEKNIRGGKYNNPPLYFVRGHRPRLIGRAAWETGAGNGQAHSPTKLSGIAGRSASVVRLPDGEVADVPADLMQSVRVAFAAQIGESLGATLVELVRRGLIASRGEIQNRLANQLESLDD